MVYLIHLMCCSLVHLQFFCLCKCLYIVFCCFCAVSSTFFYSPQEKVENDNYSVGLSEIFGCSVIQSLEALEHTLAHTGLSVNSKHYWNTVRLFSAPRARAARWGGASEHREQSVLHEQLKWQLQARGWINRNNSTQHVWLKSKRVFSVFHDWA